VPQDPVDVCIVGAGPTGLSLALALSGGTQKIVVLDTGGATQGTSDPRALALAHGSRQVLERLGAWPAGATPITDIHVSQQHGLGIARLRANEFAVPALGYVVRYGELLQKLRSTAAARRNSGIELRYGTTLVAAKPGRDGQSLTVSDGTCVPTRLLVHAEGARDDGASRNFDYRQSAIVCEATPATPHRNLAWERFTPEGPLALLPLGDTYAVVLTVPSDQEARFLALDDRAFATELSRRLDGRLHFSRVTRRAAFALKLRLRGSLHEAGEVWLGNAAQTLHPVSGQGFNLGLRDAWTLAEAWRELEFDAARGAAFDPAAQAAVLRRWEQSRQLDRFGGAGFTDGIVRLFSNRWRPLQIARGFGLAALNVVPGGRAFVARRMIWGARAW
jgi:2-octaprenyl-6-methoxyphenol hydroxylase